MSEHRYPHDEEYCLGCGRPCPSGGAEEGVARRRWVPLPAGELTGMAAEQADWLAADARRWPAAGRVWPVRQRSGEADGGVGRGA